MPLNTLADKTLSLLVGDMYSSFLPTQVIKLNLINY